MQSDETDSWTNTATRLQWPVVCTISDDTVTCEPGTRDKGQDSHSSHVPIQPPNASLVPHIASASRCKVGTFQRGCFPDWASVLILY